MLDSDKGGFAGHERYEQIVRTAEGLFEKQGYAGTSLRQLSESVGIQKASLYYYFESKGHLFEAVHRSVTEPLQTLMSTIDRDQPPCKRLSAIIRNHVDLHVAHGAFMRIVWAERYELPAPVYRAVRTRERDYEQFVVATIEDGRRRGCLKGYRTDLLTSAFLGLLTTVYRWRREPSDDDQFRSEAAELIEHFVFGSAEACPIHGALRSEP